MRPTFQDSGVALPTSGKNRENEVDQAFRREHEILGRALSLPKSVAAAGGIQEWNAQSAEVTQLYTTLLSMCKANSVAEALREVGAIMTLGHNLWAYAYMRTLYNRSPDLYYATLIARPAMLLPVVYTPTVGEACQKFGKLPFFRRGCYVSITDRGNVKKVLQEYAEVELGRDDHGNYKCDCIVFSDGGRILGLGDLGAWGMGIPIGKLDLYTVCAGVNPYHTMPVILDAGCYGAEGNTDKLVVRDHPRYTGLKQDRVTHVSAAGTVVNIAYYGEDSLVKEFMEAASDLFGSNCMLQFEDFNSNDAFPLLAEHRGKFLTYNDDIQGTAAVTVAGLLGAVKLRNPSCTDLIAQLRKERFFFHGAGSANIGALSLMANEAHVPRSSMSVTNSRGVIWRSADGSEGSFRNGEQKEFAQVGRPDFDGRDLVACIDKLAPTCLVGAVGRDPSCFNEGVVHAMVRARPETRPVIFALSNPRTQAEVTARDAYVWSKGRAIFGSGTAFEPVVVDGQTRTPGQVNNVYIFPGMSFGAISCHARTIPERFFMVAAEAVAHSLTPEDLKMDRVMPHPDNLREVELNVATAVVMEAQAMGLAGKKLGDDRESVRAALKDAMWSPASSSSESWK